jgi:mannosyltransferase
MNMVLYYLLLRGWLHFGDSVAFIRGLSVVFASAAIPAIFMLGRRLQGSVVGMVSALLLAVNAFQVRYAQEARSYSLLVFLLILSTYFFVSAVPSGHKRNWNWYIAISALAVYAHFFAILVVLSHWGALRIARYVGIASDGGMRAQSNRAVRLTLVWTLPIWIFIATTGAGPIAWIPRPGIGDIVGLFKKLSGNAQTPLLIVYSICVALGLLVGIRAIRRRESTATNNIVLTCWLFGPLAIVLLASLARPVFAPRYLMISLPAWILLAAQGIASLRPRLVGMVAAGAIVWLGIGGVRSYYKVDFDIGRNDVRSATNYILDHAAPDDGIVFYSLGTRFPYDYYAAHRLANTKPDILWPGSNAGLGWRDFMGVPSPRRVPAFAQRHERIWVVTTPMPPNDPKFAAFQTALTQQYQLTGATDFPFIRVMLFSR